MADYSLWQSSNEGYSWVQHYPQETFLAFYHHKYSSDRAYAITSGKKIFYTTNTGRSWHSAEAPTLPNTFGQAVLHFHPESDYLIWTGEDDCSGRGENCHAVAHYSRDNGRTWNLLDTYIRNCAWARDATLFTDPTEIICESYKEKTGNQKQFQLSNPLELIEGTNYYGRKKKLFDHVVGFAKFSEYLIVAEVRRTLASILIFPLADTSYPVPATETRARYPGFSRWNKLRDRFIPTNDATRSTRLFISVSV